MSKSKRVSTRFNQDEIDILYIFLLTTLQEFDDQTPIFFPLSKLASSLHTQVNQDNVNRMISDVIDAGFFDEIIDEIDNHLS